MPYPLCHVPKRERDIAGHTLRSVAENEYGRSKSSFIRDVDGAFEREDLAFLDNFRVYLNDGTMIAGAEATKDKMRSVQKMQPRVYIRTTFLETRYWEQGDSNTTAANSKSKAVKKKEEGTQRHPKLKGASEAIQLEHDNVLLKQQLRSEQEKNDILEKNNGFLQEELENRRGELEEMTKFADAMRLGIEAGKKDGEHTSTPESTVVDGNVVNSATGKGTTVIDADVEEIEKGTTAEKIRQGIDTFMDFINQPLGKERDRSSSSASTNEK